MILEVGKKYVTRDGERTVIIESIDHETRNLFCVFAKVISSQNLFAIDKTYSYTKEGSYWFDEDDKDLVKQID